MPNYKYVAMNNKGEKISGYYMADMPEEVLAMIEENDYLPIQIKEQIDPRDKDIFEGLKRVTTKDIYIFCRQFHTMIDAGSNISSALDVLRIQTENTKFKKVINVLYEDVQKGISLSEAMGKHNKIFPDLLINMIETGEVSGNLDLILERMAMHYENENKVNNKVKSAMVYPVVLMILSISVVAFLMIFIMPVFINMFESMGTKLPVPTLMLMGISKALTSYWYIIISILGIVGYGVKKGISTPNGKYALDRVKLSLPVIKNLNEKVIVARFTRTLSTILTSGISLVSGLEAVEKVIGNKVVERKLSIAREQILKGINLSEALGETKAFPPMLNSMIKIGEESGKLDEILDRTANFYDEELDTSIKQFTTIIEPIMIVIMGGIIAFIVLAMMMPMFNMYSAL